MTHASAAELEVRRIRELVAERQFAQGLAAADALLVTVPENRDVLYLRALSQRMCGDIPAALATLVTLERLHPRFSRLHQERGHCYVALKQAPEAIEAFLRGVRLNPALLRAGACSRAYTGWLARPRTPRRRPRRSRR